MSSASPGWRRALRHLQPLVPQAENGLLCLAYHLVGANSQSPVDLPRSTFEQQMQELHDNARVLALEEALALLESNRTVDAATIVLTFDDAYANFLEVAWPILERYRLPAALFVPIDFVNGTGPPPIAGTAGLPPLSWSQLEQLAAEPRCTLGSHSRSHPDLRQLDGEALRDEIQGSKLMLEARLGVPVRGFCYPRALSSASAERQVDQSYDIGFVAGGRRVTARRWRRARTPRLPIRRDMPESLLPVLNSRVWIEEAVADRMRRFRNRAA